MKSNTTNNGWASISRGALAVILFAATFCGICGLGAAFNHIPWLMIAGGLCLLAIATTLVWGLGFKSRTCENIKPTASANKVSKAYDQDNGNPPPREVFDFDKS